MASIFPGYEYDIFVSYRQKDNKYDGWVTIFIDNLKKEIDATFKEDISVYFDENPHDGILEIHNVDKTLDRKLKSLIFIPVISQTYCDPKSFAWQSEFVAFNKMASSDPIGRDIELSNGNVISRIIPVRIHDLDPSDVELIESETGSRFRSIDFIFSGAGINRPLKPDDNPDKNQYKTYYRDQINKVANAVKDVISSLHSEPKRPPVKIHQPAAYPVESGSKTELNSSKKAGKVFFSPRTLALGIPVLLLLITAAIFLPRWLKMTKSETSAADLVRKAIAVLPVANLTGNLGLDYMAEAIQDDLTGRLGTISGFIVRPKASTLQFKGTRETTQQIARKLSANNMLESSLKGDEDNLKIEVRLINAFPDEKYVWSSSFPLDWGKISEIYRDIITKVVDGTKVRLTSLESKNLSVVQKINPEIKKLCDQGTFYINKNTKEDFEKGLVCFNKAMAIDPGDPLPYLGLALGYSNAGHMSSVAEDASGRAKSYAIKALDLDSTLADAHVVLATRYLYTEWDFPRAERHLKRAVELNPSIPSALYTWSWYLTLKNKVDEAIEEMKKSVEVDPTNETCQGYLAWIYFYFGIFEKAVAESQKLLQLNPNSSLAYYLMGSSYAEMGMHSEAIEMHRKGLSLSPGFEQGLAIAYARAGQKDKAFEVAVQMEKNKDQWWYAFGLAETYATLGEWDKAIYYIDLSFRLHGDFVPWIKSDPYFKPILNNPDFKAIANRLKLPV